MTKIQKKLNQRLQSLENRTTILIQLNYTNGFTQSGHPKGDQYFAIINEIRNQKGECYRLISAEHKKTFEHGFLMSTMGLNGAEILSAYSLNREDLFNLTAPAL